MEPKVIIYIVVGVLYFIYSISKKAQEQKTTAPKPAPAAKPVTPPDVMRDLKQQRAEAEMKRRAAAQQPKPAPIQKQAPKEILVRQTKPATMGEGTSDYAPIYERPLTEEEKIHSGNVRIKDEGVYQHQGEQDGSFEFDARQAFIGSVIFERKY